MKTTIELALDRDHELDIPVGAVLRLAPMRDEDGRVIGYWLVNDATDEPIDLVAVDQVRVTRE